MIINYVIFEILFFFGFYFRMAANSWTRGSLFVVAFAQTHPRAEWAGPTSEGAFAFSWEFLKEHNLYPSEHFS